MIPAVHNDMISDAFHPPFHAVHTFCCLIASADLIVIEKIFCTDLYRGKIRHDNVSASKDPELAPERMDRAERRRCGKQDIRILKTEKSHHKQGEFHGPCSLVSKRCVMLRIPTISGLRSRIKIMSPARHSDVWYGEPTIKPQPVW